MNKINDFLNEHDLKSELLNDKSFVNSAEELFEQQGVKFSKDQLEEIVGDINENLESVRKMSPEELASIAGGVPKEDIMLSEALTSESEASNSPSTASGIAIKATTTILGAVLGAGVGFLLGIRRERSVTKDKEGSILQIESSTSYSPFPAVVGGGVGSVLGAQLGNMIVKKYHL